MKKAKLKPRRIPSWLKVNTVVFDVDWPWRWGVVRKRLLTRLYVEFYDDEEVKYDVAHTQFLRKAPG